MVRQTAARGTVQAFSTINTISARLVDANGGQALPGKGRDRSGVCGSAIRGAGLDMVSRLAAIRERLGLDYAIIGVGGVVAPEDYRAYRAARRCGDERYRRDVGCRAGSQDQGG